MWVPIFEQNSEYILEVIDTYLEKLTEFKTSIKENNNQNLIDLISQANQIQKIL